jgi:hypothetical protein
MMLTLAIAFLSVGERAELASFFEDRARAALNRPARDGHYYFYYGTKSTLGRNQDYNYDSKSALCISFPIISLTTTGSVMNRKAPEEQFQ